MQEQNSTVRCLYKRGMHFTFMIYLISEGFLSKYQQEKRGKNFTSMYYLIFRTKTKFITCKGPLLLSKTPTRPCVENNSP
jgi:hypothetical protein